MKTAFLSLGSNVGDRERNLEAALRQLAAPSLYIRRVSSVYETEPVDYTGQRWFLNLAVEAETELFPMQLLWRIAKVEHQLGRVRTIDKGPRTIDIDILFYGRAVIRTAALEVPHPRIAARRFVLAPLAELTPELRHPVTHQTVREMLDAAPPQTVRRLALPIKAAGA